MKFIDDLNAMTLFIAPVNVKDKILMYINDNNLFFPFKIMSLTDIKKQLYFDVDENAICYLEDKYKIKRDIAKTYIDNLYYITDDNIENMNLLRSLKEDLIKNNLLIFHPLFKNYLKQCNVIVYGFDGFTKFEIDILNKIKEITNVKEINPLTYDIKEAYLCQNIDEELKNIFEEISLLVENNVSLNNIYLTNVRESDYQKIRRMASTYHIPVTLKNNYLYATPIYKKIKEAILTNNITSVSSPYLNILLNKINKIKIKETYDMEKILDAYAKEIKVNEEYTNCLKISPLIDNIYTDSDYVFILNANTSILPKTYKDEDFLFDRIKPSILEKSYEKNVLEFKKTKNALLKIKNKKIYLIKEENGNLFYPSQLLENALIHEVEPCNISYFSHLQNKRNLTILYDFKRKYGIANKSFITLKNSYSLDYLTYDNSFKGIDKHQLEKYLDSKLTLSYSTLNTFYECQFKYYLSSILKLEPFKENFNTTLGTIIHEILKNSPENIDEYICKYLKDKNISLSNKERFYLNLSIPDLESTFSFYKNFKEHSTFEKEDLELKICIPIDSKFDITFMGIIDKRLISPDSNLILIDYKTGNTKFNLKDTYYGLSMQLPIYYYITKKNDPDKKIVGFYLQHILDKNFKYIKNKTVEMQKQESLKLNGYSLNNEEILEKLDSTYKDSRFIKSLKISQNGFYSYSKVLTEKELDGLYNLTSEKIKNMIFEVENANFKINPKKLRNENISCRFCKYKSICFMKEKDIEELNEMKDLNFLKEA